VLRGGRCLPDVLARAERDLPAGFFTLAALERFMQLGLASRGSSNSFADPDADAANSRGRPQHR
jgi:hypothetical protein